LTVEGIEMDTLKNTMTHYSHLNSEFPNGLKTAEEISLSVKMPVDRIIELTEAMYIPHFRCDDSEPMYKISEVKKWAAENVLCRFEGKPYPPQLRIISAPEPAKYAPSSIGGIDNLCVVKESVPGVYFLVLGDQVVYIGQSVNPPMRVSQHRKNKEFSNAFFIPVIKSELDAVEGALIRLMNPPLNSGDMLVAMGPKTERNDIDILADIGINKLDMAG
jgi:hypothetical protein